MSELEQPNRKMIDTLVERLLAWERVFPCDESKPEGSLYVEAADRIKELEAKLLKYEGASVNSEDPQIKNNLAKRQNERSSWRKTETVDRPIMGL